ncbi:hypothetical protein [Micromonospora sp. CA-111912]|uniref:hypothetical protein n=1 Tax=Micromonospora sp. CA-111912 TaxID=3239955 RepID=UPI003D90570D
MPKSSFPVGSTRRQILATATTATLALLASAGCAEDQKRPESPPGPDPERLIAGLIAGLSAVGPHRNPTSEERAQAREVAQLLLTGRDDRAGQEELFGTLGFEAHHGDDPATGRPFSLFLATGSDDRTWGVVLVDRSAAPRWVIEVPHPGFDINTELLGLALHRQVPGSVLLIAGAHRQAAKGAADVAHNSRSLFHVLAIEFARNGLHQMQLHGFADRNLRDAQAVVSTGSAPTNRLARRIADGLSEAGLTTCRAWAQRCGQLEGTRNAQGLAAADLDTAYIHLELSWSVRGDEEGRDRVVKALADRLTAN